MAKNDYPVIVYQILSYLYKCLKSGNDVQGILLNYDSPMFDKINKKYWEYIMHNLVKYNLIEGIIEVNVDGKPTPYITGLENCMITPKGIEYLTDNSFLSKAKEFLKDVREIVPFSLNDPLKMVHRSTQYRFWCILIMSKGKYERKETSHWEIRKQQKSPSTGRA